MGAAGSVAHDRLMALLQSHRDDDSARRSVGLKLRKRPTLRARLRAAWSAAELDEALADGADPLASDELALRAAQLVEPATRAKLARSIELVVEQVAAGGPSPLGPTILRREPIARNRPALLALARRLRREGFHCLRGLAMADRLIRLGDSPLYMALGPLQLTHRIEEILAALEPGWDGLPADMPHGDSRWPA
jgi:hypothetical protein